MYSGLPRRSVWSQPHRLGTLASHRLCTFMSQPAERSQCRSGRLAQTFAFQPLVYQAVEERAAMVAEGGTGVGVRLELVLRSRPLKLNAR